MIKVLNKLSPREYYCAALADQRRPKFRPQFSQTGGTPHLRFTRTVSWSTDKQETPSMGSLLTHLRGLRIQAWAVSGAK